MKKESGRLFRTSLTIPKELDSFLHELGIEMRENNGYKLPKTEIIRGLIRANKIIFENGSLDIEGIKSEDEFAKRLLEAYKKRR